MSDREQMTAGPLFIGGTF